MGKRIKDLTRTETDGYLAVDNATNGTGKMNSSIIFNNFAGRFVPNETEAQAGRVYIYQGVLYLAKQNYTGDWDATKFVSGSISSLSQLAQSREFSIVGANLTVQNVYIPLCRGINKIKVKANPNPWPTDTIGGSNPNILIIYGVAADGTETYLKSYTISVTVPEEISVDLPPSAVILRFFVRANNQAVVTFSVINATRDDDLVERVEDLEDEAFQNKIAESNDAFKLTLTGLGGTLVQKDFEMSAFDEITIEPSVTNWSDSSLPSDANKFWIRLTKKDNTVSDLFRFAKGSALPSKIVLTTDEIKSYGDVVGWSIHFRADQNTAVDFWVHYNCYGASFNPMKSLFRLGNVNISTDALVYSASISRAVSKQGLIVDFKAGDVISVDSGYRMYIAISSNGAAPYTRYGWITRYKFTADAKLSALLISKDPEVAGTLDEFVSAIHIVSKFNAFSPNCSAFVEDALFGSVILGAVSGELNGSGMTAAVKKYLCNGGTQFIVSLSKTEWSVSSLSEQANKFCIRWVSKDGVSTNIVLAGKNTLVTGRYIVNLPEDAVAIDIFFRGDTGETVDYTITNVSEITEKKYPVAGLVKSVNHRGYNSLAPENTLPAYRISAKKGFSIVETDVWACGDGTFVCIHDSTVDRTSDGTGSVTSMTLEQLKALDFGSWFSSAYAGTKIPTLSEFLVACRNLGLKAYIELKGLANSSVANLVKEVKSLGMAESVTYICFTYSYLQEVVLADKKARVGYLLNTISETDVQDAVALKTDENEVFINAANAAVTSESVALAKSYGVPIEQWTAELSEVDGADPYVSGFTSNYTIASDILYSKEIMK